VIPYTMCFAKSTNTGGLGMTVAQHCCISGYVADVLLGLMPECVRDLFPKGTSFLVAAHDVGKVSPGFQKKYFNEALKSICPELAALSMEAVGLCQNHAEIGEAAFVELAKKIRGRSDGLCAWGEAIGVHHGTRKTPQLEGVRIYGGNVWATERVELLEQLNKYFCGMPEHEPSPEKLKLVSGLTCVSDWIASNEDFFPNDVTLADDEMPSQVTRALGECGWVDHQVKSGLEFHEVFPFAPNEMQSGFANLVDRRGLFILEAPMGQGKTEAALFAAYKLIAAGENRGLYFGLPTRLTSDRIHTRVEEFMTKVLVDSSYVKLVHGHAWLDGVSTIREFQAGMGWFHPRKRALLAPFGVGTIDQALMSVLKVKHHFVRTFGLAGKVVILDEVHSYDAYTGALLNCLVEELLKIGCSVIILSATLTAERRIELGGTAEAPADYPLISTKNRFVIPPLPQDQKVEVSLSGELIESLAERAVAQAENGACVLWIVNTVAKSQEIFKLVNSIRKEDSFRTGLLHSRFPAFRRRELEDDWMAALDKTGKRRPKGCILVATQVVEQSVDIDADLLITELAPTDMLLQRIGRLWRHQRDARPTANPQVWICGPDDDECETAQEFKDALGDSQYVYAPFVLWKTMQVWQRRSHVIVPRDIRMLLEATYADDIELPEWVEELKSELDGKRKKLRGMALGMTAVFSGSDDENYVSTRYSTRPTIQILLLRECDDRDNASDVVLADGSPLALVSGERNIEKAKRIHENIVSLPIFTSERVSTPRWLSTTVYGDVMVLKIVGEKLRNLVGEDAPLGYHSNIGIYKCEDVVCVEDSREFDW